MALITNVNIGVTGNSLNGTNTALPQTFGVAKSYAYDEAQYAQSDTAALQLSVYPPTWAAGTATTTGLFAAALPPSRANR